MFCYFVEHIILYIFVFLIPINAVLLGGLLSCTLLFFFLIICFRLVFIFCLTAMLSKKREFLLVCIFRFYFMFSFFMQLYLFVYFYFYVGLSLERFLLILMVRGFLRTFEQLVFFYIQIVVVMHLRLFVC